MFRNGLIGLFVGLTLVFLLIILSAGVHDVSDAYGDVVGKIFDFFAYILLLEFFSKENFPLIESIPIISVYLFILGLFIGFLINKIRSFL